MSESPRRPTQGLDPASLARAQEVERRAFALFEEDPLLAPHARFAFEPRGELGRGGMGQVLRVYDKRLERDAALKVLHDPRADDELRRRFLREARLLARLAHPNIPPVYESGVSPDGTHYLLMKLVRGATLRALLDEAPDRPSPEVQRQRLGWLIKVCEAVVYAHASGVLHRDIKPANIMIGEFGEVLLMDWGIARASDAPGDAYGDVAVSPAAGGDLTAAGTTLGTPGYAAPEQLAGEEVDERADVFALGALLTELLSGRRAVPGDTAMDRLARASAGAFTPRDHGARVSWELNEVARRALAPDPDDRTPTAERLLEQLQAALADAEVPGIPTGLLRRLGKAARKRAAPLLGGAALMLGGAIAIAAYAVSQGELERGRRLSLESRLALSEERSARLEAESQAAEAQTRLDLSEQERARVERSLDHFAAARDLLRRKVRGADLIRAVELAMAESRSPTRDVLEAAELLREAREPKRAQALLKEVTEAHKPAYEALFLLHTLQSGGSDALVQTPALLELVTRARARGDVNEFTLYKDASDAFVAEDYEGALAHIASIEELSLELPWSWTLKGLIYGTAGRMAPAEEAFTEAIRLGESNPVVFLRRGFARSFQGKAKAALSDLERADAEGLRSSDTLRTKAYLEGQLGRVVEGLDSIDHALALAKDTERPIAHNVRAVLRGMTGDVEGALEDYRASYAGSPPRLDAAIGAALYLDTLGRAEAGRVIAAETLPEGSLNALLTELFLLTSLGRFDEAEAAAARCAELYPDDPFLFGDRGRLRVAQGRLEEAEEDLGRCIAAVPDYKYAFVARSDLRRRRGDLRGALEDAEAAFRYDRCDSRALLRRGLLRLELGERGGRSDLAELLRRLPTGPLRAQALAALANTGAEARADGRGESK